VTVLNTGRTVPTPEESPWYHDAANGPTKLTGGVDRAEDLDTTLAEEFGADWAFDHVFVTYGKLRATAPLFVGRCGRFYSAGGMVTHDTWGIADDSDTRTVSVRGQAIPPHTEDTPHMTADGTISGEPQSFNPKLNKIIESEAVVFAHHPNAFHVRCEYITFRIDDYCIPLAAHGMAELTRLCVACGYFVLQTATSTVVTTSFQLCGR
jgi:hypothetical protein